MTGRRTAIITAMALAVVAALGAVSRAPAAPLLPLGSIPIAEVTGRITDLALDYANRRLFVLEDDPGAVAAIDLTTGTATQILKGLPAARGLAHEPPNGQLYVTLGNGKVAALEGVPLRRTAILTIGPNLTKPCYDAGTTRVYLGYARRAIAAIDTAHNRILPSIYLDGDPGPLAFESLGARLFVAALGEGRILLADRAANREIGSWSTGDHGEVAALALDEEARLLIAAFRRTADLAWFDLSDGSPKGRTSACSEPARLIMDSLRARLYLTCGEGRIEIFQRNAAGGYSKAGAVETAPGRDGGFADTGG